MLGANSIQAFKNGPKALLPTAGLILFGVTFAFLAVFCMQLEMAREISGEPPIDTTPYWTTLGLLAVCILGLFKWASVMSRPRASEVIATRRPWLESEAQRLALKQIIRLESQLG